MTVKPLVNPRAEEVRGRVTSYGDSAFVASFLWGSRVDEFCGKKLNEDINSIPLYPSNVTIETFRPAELDMEMLTSAAGSLTVYERVRGKERVDRVFGDFYDGEFEVAVFDLTTIKRKDLPRRKIPLPLDPAIEPLTGKLLHAFRNPEGADGEVWYRSRWEMWSKARRLFDGWGYMVKPQIIYLKDEFGRAVKGDNGKGVVDRVEPEHMKPAGNHFLRHKAKERLRSVHGFSDSECELWLGHKPVGQNAADQRYGEVGWRLFASKMILPVLLRNLA
jgi:hypothetical protein